MKKRKLHDAARFIDIKTFFTFLNFFIFQTFVIFKKTLTKQSCKQINKNQFQNNSNEIDL